MKKYLSILICFLNIGISFPQNVKIYNEVNGLPKVKFYGVLKDYLNHGKELKISMSHSENYVTCVAVLLHVSS